MVLITTISLAEVSWIKVYVYLVSYLFYVTPTKKLGTDLMKKAGATQWSVDEFDEVCLLVDILTSELLEFEDKHCILHKVMC